MLDARKGEAPRQIGVCRRYGADRERDGAVNALGRHRQLHVHLPSRAAGRISGPYGFNVPTGVAFAVKVPIYQNNTMYKTGAGTLALGGAMTFGTNNLCRVREGGLTALSDAAVAELDCTFADGTAIVLSPDSTAANGFRNLAIEDAAGGAAGKVNVQLAVPPEGIDGTVTLPICTVPEASPLRASSTTRRPS